MSRDIVTKESLTFKNLEEIIFKTACDIANEMFKNILEEYDAELVKSRDKSKYRHKGYEVTTVKTKTGCVTYKRAKYIELKEDGTKRCTYLTDEMLALKKVGQFSSGLIDLVVKNIKEMSFRSTAKNISNCTGLDVSGAGIWNIIQKLGEEIKRYEKEKVEMYQDDKLESGTKETPVVYQEADGICIYTQGKTRKDLIERFKKNNPNEEVPKRVRNIEIKLGMTYEGWKKKSKGRYELVEKEYVSGYMTGKEMANITNANLHGKYNMEKVELRVLNSDGASWIKKLLVNGAIYQADSFHVREKISRQVKEKEDSEQLINMFWKKEYKEMLGYIDNLKYKYGGDCEEIIKLEKLKKYLIKREKILTRYNESEEIKNKLKRYSKQTGLRYRNMGCGESNNYSVLTRRFKRRRMSWGKRSSENLAKVITTYASTSCTDIVTDLKIQVIPESFVEYANRYIEQIEKEVKKSKQEKRKSKKGYNFKSGTLVGHPNIQNILKLTPLSRMRII